jgi:hypothetical protein
MSTDSCRLSILTAQEIDDLYGLPRFTEDDRRLHFHLSPKERDLVEGVRTMSAAVHLILQLGYFKFTVWRGPEDLLRSGSRDGTPTQIKRRTERSGCAGRASSRLYSPVTT